MNARWKIWLIILITSSLSGAFFLGRKMEGGGEAGRVDRRDSSLEQIFRREAKGWSLSESSAAERTLELMARIDLLETSDDFRAMLGEIETRADKSEKERFLALFFSAWLERDPMAALSEVRRVELLRRSPTRVGKAFFEWASINPSSAAALLAQVLDGRQSDPKASPPFLDGVDPPDFLLSIVDGLGVSDPKLAAVTLERAGKSLARKSAVEVLLQSWYASDPGGVREWASNVKDPVVRRSAIEVTASEAGQLDEVDPGISWAMGLPDEAEKRAALLALTGQWSQRRSADAFAWARSLADEDLKLELMPGVLRQFAILDPGSAADWLNLYEASPAMDASVAAYAKAIQFTNPEAALGSAAAIKDPKLRAEVVSTIQRNQSR